MKLQRQIRSAVILTSLVLAWPTSGRAQVLETETARFLHRGAVEFGTGFELQTSTEGTERAVPLAAEIGLSNRLALLLEPVVYTSIRPKNGPRATGRGDAEVTALGLLRSEGDRAPAMALALEVKVPTTKNTLIGTGKTDVAGFLIGSKHLGRLDVHANIGYTVLGKPAGVQLSNIWSGAIAGEYPLKGILSAYGEVLANTSSTSEAVDTGTTTGVAPEIVGGEVSGTIGLGVRPAHSLLFSLGLSVDNKNAFLIRPGVTFWH